MLQINLTPSFSEKMGKYFENVLKVKKISMFLYTTSEEKCINKSVINNNRCHEIPGKLDICSL